MAELPPWEVDPDDLARQQWYDEIRRMDEEGRAAWEARELERELEAQDRLKRLREYGTVRRARELADEARARAAEPASPEPLPPPTERRARRPRVVPEQPDLPGLGTDVPTAAPDAAVPVPFTGERGERFRRFLRDLGLEPGRPGGDWGPDDFPAEPFRADRPGAREPLTGEQWRAIEEEFGRVEHRGWHNLSPEDQARTVERLRRRLAPTDPQTWQDPYRRLPPGWQAARRPHGWIDLHPYTYRGRRWWRWQDLQAEGVIVRARPGGAARLTIPGAEQPGVHFEPGPLSWEAERQALGRAGGPVAEDLMRPRSIDVGGMAYEEAEELAWRRMVRERPETWPELHERWYGARERPAAAAGEPVPERPYVSPEARRAVEGLRRGMRTERIPVAPPDAELLRRWRWRYLEPELDAILRELRDDPMGEWSRREVEQWIRRRTQYPGDYPRAFDPEQPWEWVDLTRPGREVRRLPGRALRRIRPYVPPEMWLIDLALFVVVLVAGVVARAYWGRRLLDAYRADPSPENELALLEYILGIVDQPLTGGERAAAGAIRAASGEGPRASVWELLQPGALVQALLPAARGHAADPLGPVWELLGHGMYGAAVLGEHGVFGVYGLVPGRASRIAIDRAAAAVERARERRRQLEEQIAPAPQVYARGPKAIDAALVTGTIAAVQAVVGPEALLARGPREGMTAADVSGLIGQMRLLADLLYPIDLALRREQWAYELDRLRWSDRVRPRMLWERIQQPGWVRAEPWDRPHWSALPILEWPHPWTIPTRIWRPPLGALAVPIREEPTMRVYSDDPGFLPDRVELAPEVDPLARGAPAPSDTDVGLAMLSRPPSTGLTELQEAQVRAICRAEIAAALPAILEGSLFADAWAEQDLRARRSEAHEPLF